MNQPSDILKALLAADRQRAVAYQSVIAYVADAVWQRTHVPSPLDYLEAKVCAR